MWEAFLTGLVAGMAATPHCLGMCGAFPLYMAKPSEKGSAALRIVLFLFGKSFTYTFLGALAASLGVILFRNLLPPTLAPYLKLLFGVVVIAFGLSMLGVRLSSISVFKATESLGFLHNFLAKLAHETGPFSALALGLAVGFLPCPLPLGMLAASAASHSPITGMLLMAGVGMGTAPGLFLLGISGLGLNKALARTGMTLAAIAVLLVGFVMVGRAGHAMLSRPASQQSLPACCGSIPSDSLR